MRTLSSLSLTFVALLSHVVCGLSSRGVPSVPRNHHHAAGWGVGGANRGPVVVDPRRRRRRRRRQTGRALGIATGTARMMMPGETFPFPGRATTTTKVRGGGGGGGEVVATTSTSKKASLASSHEGGSRQTGCPYTKAMAGLSSVLGTGGVVYILCKAIARVLPIAMEPFKEGSVPLSQFQLGAYVVTCIWFAYVEGYKGFQQKFSPLVVKRSLTLVPGRNGTKWYHFLVAPLYSMGLFHATRKRRIVSWSVTMGVTAIVAAVKRLPYPWRNIVDAGVVVGLSWGSLSIVLFYIKALMDGKPPENVDAALPDVSKAQ